MTPFPLKIAWLNLFLVLGFMGSAYGNGLVVGGFFPLIVLAIFIVVFVYLVQGIGRDH